MSEVLSLCCVVRGGGRLVSSQLSVEDPVLPLLLYPPPVPAGAPELGVSPEEDLPREALYWAMASSSLYLALRLV